MALDMPLGWLDLAAIAAPGALVAARKRRDRVGFFVVGLGGETARDLLLAAPRRAGCGNGAAGGDAGGVRHPGGGDRRDLVAARPSG
ncbi:hypothetical protein JYK14_21815 [Siccirubricoccus sp. KC 17139]|uniref:Uncharacterized protein n=1 Tax=Siccirubricoccus soli TaxID=2899147 RepID=A0ABT1DA20_9PROT|nr:hypothetical protein [Siccirubricoccus soli]MCO6418776.1 hypothetical protein [Siccirubricoccus soli]MCP2684911.1 hypothetical protein [Siccirubricoccus soli]